MANPRASDELRPLHFETDYVLYPAGSVLVSMGNTKVLCTASVDESLPRWLRYSSSRHGWVTAEYAMLPGSTQKRTPREGAVPRGRTQEIKRLIGRSLRAAVDLTLLGERQIIVDCDVLQADGGAHWRPSTAVSWPWRWRAGVWWPKGVIAENPVKRTIAAVSVGMVGGDAYLDLDYRLDLAADVDFNVVMTDDERFVEVQGTAEGEPYDRNELDWMLELAATGVRQIVAAQRQVLANVQV
ncbi:MAG: ribonuclease PH [Caldilineaceae bacterium]